VRPDQAAVAAAGLGLQILGRDGERLQTELAERDEGEALVVEIADPARRHHVEMEAAVVAREDDRVELYRCGRNMRRRKESERAHRRVQRGLHESFSKSKVSRGDRGTSLR
jgi:hypothetical protein